MQDVYEVKAHDKPVVGNVQVPGSKSITNRALLLASVARGKSVLQGTLFSDDTRAFMDCLVQLGYNLSIDEAGKTVSLTGGIPRNTAKINVNSAGTAARFLTALLAVSNGTYHVASSEQMMKRPMKPLLDTLAILGAKVEYGGEAGYFPVQLIGGESGVSCVEIESFRSSQFLSALLMTGCLYRNGLQIHTKGKEVATSYVDITLNMIQDFKGSAKRVSSGFYRVEPGNRYIAQQYIVEPDVSAACYFFAIPALTGGSVTVENVHRNSMQGDIQFLGVLEKMGCTIEDVPTGTKVTGPARLSGIDVDMNDFSDQAMTLAALAPFASTPTTIRNIAHIAHQETNRLQAIYNELQRLGIKCAMTDSSLHIEPGIPQAATIHTYDDHRMAMAFSLVGLKTRGIKIENPSCVNKTFENYFEIFEKLVYC